MHHRRPMRLLLREHGICGGAETVNIHLVQQFTELVDRVVWIVPEWRLKFFQQILPPSDRLFYEPLRWPEHTQSRMLQKAMALALRWKTLPARVAFQKADQKLSDLRLRHLVRQHQITHCFVNWTFCVDVPRIGIPIGTMLMDVRWKLFPETFPDIDIKKVDEQFCNWLRKSSIVFPVSESTASDIKRFYPWHAGQTRVVPHGADHAAHNGTRTTGTIDFRDRCVFFAPAAANGHKNHITLFRACAELLAKGFDFDVVLTGFKTEHFRQDQLNGDQSTTAEAAVEDARVFLHQNEGLFQGRIKPLGYVQRGQVDALYKQASAVVLPSFFEGFGLPLIEALQNGAAVICSDIPAHREQLVRYGCMKRVTIIPPMDVSALATEMEKVIVNSKLERARNRTPPETLDRWTWRDVAETYLDSLGSMTPHNNGS